MMRKRGKGFEFETDSTIFSKGQHRKIYIVFAPPDRLGFRLANDTEIFWMTANACYDVAVKNGAKYRPSFDVAKLIQEAKEESTGVLPFDKS